MITHERIMAAVCHVLDVSEYALASDSRRRDVVGARVMYAHLCGLSNLNMSECLRAINRSRNYYNSYVQSSSGLAYVAELEDEKDKIIAYIKGDGRIPKARTPHFSPTKGFSIAQYTDEEEELMQKAILAAIEWGNEHPNPEPLSPAMVDMSAYIH